jgi:NAD(P)-dependent dehydrogenase (short-subunit alcohol dehydrogenase family)
MPSNNHAIVIGVGPGLGAALVTRFVRGGLKVSAGARDRARLRALLDERGLKDVPALRCDVTEEASVADAFKDAIAAHGAPSVVVFNASGYGRGSILDLTPGEIEAAWRVGCLGGFLVGREGARAMTAAGGGAILFTGATASMRGSANFAPFAIAKFGLRALTQSMARELGPKGIHVAHMVIDGQIGTTEGDTKMKPDDIAEAYWSIYSQPRSVWTLEADLRTWVEKF